MESEHEERLRAMSVDDSGNTWDLSDNDRAACLAGAEALRLLREYQRCDECNTPDDDLMYCHDCARDLCPVCWPKHEQAHEDGRL